MNHITVQTSIQQDNSMQLCVKVMHSESAFVLHPIEFVTLDELGTKLLILYIINSLINVYN